MYKTKSIFFSLFSLICLISGFLFSCSNSSSSITVYQEVDTLRNYVKNKEIGVLWTKEMDEKALSANIKNSKDISVNAVYSIDGVKAMKKISKPVYPSLKGFTSLDISKMDAATLSTVINFYDRVSENRGVDYKGEDTSDSETANNSKAISAIFNSTYVFNYVFFMQDMKTAWKDLTGTEYPDYYTDIEPESTESQKLFDTCFIGSPFITEECLQIPLRFVYKKKNNKENSFYIDTTITVSNDSYNLISNAEVTEWGKLNG